MDKIKITQANLKDQKQLLVFFKHYKTKKVTQNRVNCYLSHNFTNIARGGNNIIGVLQWHVKEDPNAGVAELEEFYVLENYRNQGVGALLLDFKINSIKKYFIKLKISSRKIFLFVAQNNQPAKKLYKKYHFKQICFVGNLFSDNQPELFYCLDI